ncbi:MAG: adenylate/guanylate cyclase domain-containing protein [Leptospira sp.]|nr:adenylate/guanylate cyclase domain-containing protein [Leptospira sp.]
MNVIGFIFIFILLNFNLLGSETYKIYDSKDGRIEELSGDWEFHCEEFSSTTESDKEIKIISIPSSWRDSECNGEILSAKGKFRYRIIIKGETREKGLSLFLPVAGTSMIAYWNGRLVHSAGDFLNGQPGFKPATVPISFEENNELIIDVANYDDRFGGLWYAPIIGKTTELRSIRRTRLVIDLFLSGLLFFFGIYTLLVFINIRNSLFLLIGLFSLGISFRNMVEGERIFHIIFSTDWWYTLIAIAHLSIYLSFPFLYIFIKALFKIKKWRWWEIIPMGVIILYSLLVLFTKPTFYTEFLNYAMFSLFTMVIILLVFTIRATIKGQSNAKYILLGMFFLVCAGIHDAVRFASFSYSFELVPIGLLAFVFMNIFVIERRERKLSVITEKLEHRLNEKLDTVKKLVPKSAFKFIESSISIEDLEDIKNYDSFKFTTMFADLRGFTKISETRSPEEVLLFINNFLKRIVPPILAEGGHILEYQGDGILVYFTTGAETCLIASIEMQKALRDAISKQELPDLEMGIALHAGKGVFTLLGNEKRAEPVLVSPAISEVQDLEMACAKFSLPIVFSVGFYECLGLEAMSESRYVGNLGKTHIYSLKENLV